MSGEKEKVRDIGEDALVERVLSLLSSTDRVKVGPGDDCAVVEAGPDDWTLLKTDCLIEGVHFTPGTEPRLVGAKAVNRVLSDLAAMGGRPREALVTLAVDENREVEEILGWYSGMEEAASRFGGTIVGGETSNLPGGSAVLSVAMTGRVEPQNCVRRSGAREGDLILVTGRLGGSFESGRHLTFEPRLAQSRWLVENHCPSAMMDLSDGLGSDLPRLAKASGTGYTISPDRIPCEEGVSVENAIRDGEDYELLFTICPEKTGLLMADWADQFPELSLTIIGEISGETPNELSPGWEHYRQS
ncbi:MAG: thiamine-phosphate kinase [Verrucomicrobiota bacterium]